MNPVRQLKAVDFDRNRHTMRYRIHAISSQDGMRKAMEGVIGTRCGILRPSAERSFVTFGSCFAVNVAEALERRGAKVHSTRVTEDVNSPFNNLILLRHLFRTKESSIAEELSARLNVDLLSLRLKFEKATDVIFTLGNIFRLNGPDGHTLVSLKGATLIRESFDDTVNSIKEIIGLLSTHTKAQIFVSVSPIPISGYVGIDFQSVVEADCASKSQLIAAIRTLDGFTYIPTFEIFRWLAAHQEFATLGEGGTSRHLFRAHVDTAMGILC